jgi:hypothetical protein
LALRIMIVTDAWFPQVNGVVRTLKATADELGKRGHEMIMVTPEGRWTFPLPSYPEIRLSLISAARIAQDIEDGVPEAIHIATEGPLGWAARRYCVSKAIPFTTGFHTQFAEYVGVRVRVPGARALAWSVLRHFHRPSRAVMAPTPSIVRKLEAHRGRSPSLPDDWRRRKTSAPSLRSTFPAPRSSWAMGRTVPPCNAIFPQHISPVICSASPWSARSALPMSSSSRASPTHSVS